MFFPGLMVTAAFLLAGTFMLNAQENCQELQKVMTEASAKTHSTPTHIYTETKIDGQTFSSEIIYAAGSMYTKINGKWSLDDSLKGVEQMEQENKPKPNPSDVCRHLADSPVNGEVANVYSLHSVTPKGTIDMQFWISKGKGLPLRQETNTNNVTMTSHYEYANVKPPL